MLPLLPRPPPPRRAVGSRASRGAGKRGGGAGKGSEAGSVPEQTTAPTRGRARASVTGAREPGWKRRLCPGVRRSPWSPPHARLRSLLLPPSLPEKARLQARATRRQLQELAPYWAAAPRQLRTAPFAVFKGPRAPRPPRRPALRACAPGTVATGEGRRGRLPRRAAAGGYQAEGESKGEVWSVRALPCRPAAKNNGNGRGALRSAEPCLRGAGDAEERNPGHGGRKRFTREKSLKRNAPRAPVCITQSSRRPVTQSPSIVSTFRPRSEKRVG